MRCASDGWSWFSICAGITSEMSLPFLSRRREKRVFSIIFPPASRTRLASFLTGGGRGRIVTPWRRSEPEDSAVSRREQRTE